MRFAVVFCKFCSCMTIDNINILWLEVLSWGISICRQCVPECYKTSVNNDLIPQSLIHFFWIYWNMLKNLLKLTVHYFLNSLNHSLSLKIILKHVLEKDNHLNKLILFQASNRTFWETKACTYEIKKIKTETQLLFLSFYDITDITKNML